MRLLTAKNMGFCFGVRRAVDMAAEAARERGRVYTLGELIHNREVVSELAEKGVVPIDSLDQCRPGDTVVIRSHGVKPSVYSECGDKGLLVVDCTCPFVMKIHDIVKKAYSDGYKIVVTGDRHHPECIGINGCCGDSAFFCGDFTANDAEEYFEREVKPSFDEDDRICLVSQTTFDRAAFEAVAVCFKRCFVNAVIHDTVCNTTRDRQLEAAELSSKCDVMLVLGDHHSSNTQKLASICAERCKKIKRIANIHEIPLDIIKINDIIVGVVAGASAPDSLIREVITRMSEQEKATVDCCTAENIENVAAEVTETAEQVVETVAAAAQEPVAEEGETTFEEAFEKTLVRIRNGQILTGSVVQIVDGEVCVNIGYKSDGFIPRDEFSSDPDVDPATVVSVGDKIEVEVLKVNDGEGNVLLSRKNVESKKVWEQFSTDADSEGKTVEATVKEVVKGGLIANIDGGIRAFIPASQVSTKYVEKLDEFVGQTMNVKILEVDKQRKRVVASRKAVIAAEAEEARRQKWAELVVGEKVHGVVRRLTDFGAFVDIGGFDGLVHVTDAAWGRVKHVSEVLKVGQEIEVLILNVDQEKQRISLGYKQLQPKPWTLAAEKYPVGSIVEGKVVRIVTFGAFVALEPTIDGLIHISHVGARRVAKVEDELKVGDIVRCKVLEVSPEQRRISLSRREVLIEEDPELAEQLRLEKEERERLAAERAEKRAQDAQARQQQAQQREEKRRERTERTDRPERPERRRREDADYELPPVQSSTTSLANLLGDFSAAAEETENN